MKFEINQMMRLASVKPRSEKHGDLEVLAVDLSLKGILDADEVEDLTGFPIDAFKQVFWDADGHPLGEHTLKLSTALPDYGVQISKPVGRKKNLLMSEDVAKLGYFQLEFNHGHTVELSFKIQAEVTGDDVGKVAELINHDVLVVTQEQQQALDFSDPDD